LTAMDVKLRIENPFVDRQAWTLSYVLKTHSLTAMDVKLCIENPFVDRQRR
jgi:hypothetical protein